MINSLQQLEGAYSLVMLTEKGLIAARDPLGFRPLGLGELGKGYIVASETCALDLVGATYSREIQPGEVIHIQNNTITSRRIKSMASPKHCIFEHVYFARPDSVVFGDTVHDIRKAFGQQLAKEHPIDGDIVIAVPDSGNSAALGYSETAKLPFEIGFTRNHYVGRTFIQPHQKLMINHLDISLSC